MFRSQRYRKETEAQLQGLGVPHFRSAGTRRGVGYRVTVAAEGEDRVRAARLLAAEEYTYRETPRGLEADFHLEEEARAALGLLTRAGLQGGYGRYDGEVPLWTVYAGPFPEAEARALQERLRAAGVQTYLKRAP